MTRFGAEDWLALGLSALATDGEAALRLDAITEKAGKTRGSFYHHFKNHDQFLTDLMAKWVAQNEPLLATENQTPATPTDSAGWLNALSSRLDNRLEQAIRRLASRHRIVAEAVSDVDRMRISYVRSLQADPASDASEDYALITYAAFVGLQTLQPSAPPERIADLNRLTADMIAVHWNE